MSQLPQLIQTLSISSIDLRDLISYVFLTFGLRESVPLTRR